MEQPKVKQPALISRRSDLLEAEVDGELVGLNVENGTCYGFNASATQIWALLKEPKTLSALCEALTEQFDVGPAECERDVVALLRELEADGLVTIEGSLPSA